MIAIRGGKDELMISSAQKLWVASHKEKRTIIAIKYADEKEFRYIIASNSSWQNIDIIQAYTLPG